MDSQIWTTELCSPGLPSVRVKLRRLHSREECSNVRLSGLRIRKDVLILPGVDTDDTIAVCMTVRSYCLRSTATTYRRLPCSRKAIGASGWMIISHVFLTSTPRMDLRLTFLLLVLDPRVATSLRCQPSKSIASLHGDNAYQTVAIPPS